MIGVYFQKNQSKGLSVKKTDHELTIFKAGRWVHRNVFYYFTIYFKLCIIKCFKMRILVNKIIQIKFLTSQTYDKHQSSPNYRVSQ